MDKFNGLDHDRIETDRDLMGRTNPVFDTAKMTLDQLAYTGDKTAAAISAYKEA